MQEKQNYVQQKAPSHVDYGVELKREVTMIISGGVKGEHSASAGIDCNRGDCKLNGRYTYNW